MKLAADTLGRTILMVADVAGCSGATLGLAVRMAAVMKAPLQGLFVEDEDLLQVTSLPISREIGLSTALERPTDVERMRRALRALAMQFESSLKREARALQVGYSFEYVRGSIHDIGLHERAEIGVTILERRGAALCRKTSAAAARVLWLSRDTGQELPALYAVLDNLARREIELVLVHDTSEPDMDKDIGALLGERNSTSALHRWTSEHLLEQLGRGVEFDFALLSRLGARENLAAILKSVTCPVVLVT